MNLPEQTLIDRLAHLQAAIGALDTLLPQVNDGRLTIEMRAVSEAGLALLRQHATEPGPNVADELDSLLAGLRRLANLAADPDFGLLESRHQLEAATGLLVLRVMNALDAASALGWQPRAPEMPLPTGTEVARADIAGALPHIARRLDAVSAKLDDLVKARDQAGNQFPQQNALVNFYVGSMRVEISLARMSLTLGETRIDIATLARAAETMAELTADFVATVREWVSRISRLIVEVADGMRTNVRKFTRGIGTAIKIALRTRRRREGTSDTDSDFLENASTNVSQIENSSPSIPATDISPPLPLPEDIQVEAEALILAGQRIPTEWRPFIAQLSFGPWSLDDDGTYLRNTPHGDQHQRTIALELISGLPRLYRLGLAELPITDISALSNLTQLRRLYLAETLVQNIGPLAGMSALETLDLSETLVSDLSPIQALTKLQHLELNRTKIRSLEMIEKLVDLDFLNLSNTRIRDLRPLRGLKKMSSLYLDDTLVTDLSPLTQMVNLRELSIRGVLADPAPLSHLKVLTIYGAHKDS